MRRHSLYAAYAVSQPSPSAASSGKAKPVSPGEKTIDRIGNTGSNVDARHHVSCLWTKRTTNHVRSNMTSMSNRIGVMICAEQ